MRYTLRVTRNTDLVSFPHPALIAHFFSEIDDQVLALIRV
jgi:hypothetical protein